MVCSYDDLIAVILKTKNNFPDPITILKCMLAFFYNAFSPIFILQAGDIKPWTKKIPHSYFPCCNWNVNSLATDNYSKVLALKAYNSTYKYNFICISETFLDSSFEPGNTDLVLEITIIWSDLIIQVTLKEVVFAFIVESLLQFI